MFSLFRKTAPLSTREKVWTETRMRWLADQFGIERMLNAEVILPTEDFFPDTFELGDENSARELFDRLCDHMKVARGRIKLEVLDDKQMPDALGLYEHDVISVHREQLDDPCSLTATLLHELAHVLLIGDGVLTEPTWDEERLTDLLTVFFGAGVFLANDTVRTYMYQDAISNLSYMRRHGYLTSQIFGYALALFAFHRDESDPAWARHLRPDAGEPFRAGLAYLRADGTTLFHPDTVKDSRAPLSVAAAVAKLDDDCADVRLVTMWHIEEEQLFAPELVPVIEARLRDRDPDVQAEAAYALSHFGEAGEPAVPALIERLWHGKGTVPCQAAGALGKLGAHPCLVVPELISFLKESITEMATVAAAHALSCFGWQASTALPHLLDKLDPALKDCNDRLARYLIEAMLLISPKARDLVHERYSGAHDLLTLATQLWEEVTTDNLDDVDKLATEDNPITDVPATSIKRME